ncbi:TetR/AcrR family transcriptional regulator [Serratia sp. root2]|uniref:TetR/AcrR family transcriptional regulator n=1 Tax=Serratia sp. root2 TaxID=3059676 RepID=UPI00288F3EAE|nr:TetR/AcrR family transcriptional regulator [Serratia sp. root2]MDT3249719.1 TetR/AcrR family transcriptional regulator [Serratia sp. root2]
MSGKPQYDESAVLNAAIGVFWGHGYANASISDLTEATGLSRSSLYQRFGDKDGLFNECLKLYTDRVLTRMNSIQSESSRASVDALLREFLPDSAGIDNPKGCLLSRSLTEQADLTAAGKMTMNSGICQQRQVLSNLLAKGQRTGEIGPNADLDLLAWHYFGILQSVVNLPSAGASRQTLSQLIDIAMSAWPKNEITHPGSDGTT